MPTSPTQQTGNDLNARSPGTVGSLTNLLDGLFHIHSEAFTDRDLGPNTGKCECHSGKCGKPGGGRSAGGGPGSLRAGPGAAPAECPFHVPVVSTLFVKSTEAAGGCWTERAFGIGPAIKSHLLSNLTGLGLGSPCASGSCRKDYADLGWGSSAQAWLLARPHSFVRGPWAPTLCLPGSGCWADGNE